MKRIVRSLLPLMLLAGLLVYVGAASATVYTFTGTFTLTGENVVETVAVTAGTTVTMTCSETGLGHVHIVVRDAAAGLVTDMCCVTGTEGFVPAMTGAYTFDIYNSGVEGVDWIVTVDDGVEPPVPEPEDVDVPVPGCDMFVDLPGDAVVGAFTETIVPLWGPAADQVTAIQIEAGKTAWVVGMDETGQYYKFMWGCHALWSPVSALGPNYDEVWNGTPLPVTVVD